MWGIVYVATGRGSHAAGAPTGSSTSEPAMSLVIFLDRIYIYKYIYICIAKHAGS